MKADIQRWRRDPIAFITEVCRDPENDGKPFELYPDQIAFIRAGFTVTKDGRLPYLEYLLGMIKKSGKTTLAGALMIYVVVVLAGKFGEGYCVANDLDQSTGRVFKAVVRIIEASPLLKDTAKITNNKIEFTATGATIEAIASDYAGAAGSNANIVTFDELWAATSERSRRLWDEMVPPPTRKVKCRLTVTYAGFEGESVLLEDLYNRGLKGEQIAPDLYAQPGMLMFWAHRPVAPWQTPEWIQSMRETLRPNAFLRMIENRFVSSESDFVDLSWWDECTSENARPVVSDPTLPVWVGVDASTKKDSTALVACAFSSEVKKVLLICFRTFQPSKADPLDFEATIEATLLDWKKKFRICEVKYDPWQLVSSAQRLAKAGLPMSEFPQSVPNLTEASQNLYDLIKGRNLVVYADAELRKAVSHAVAKETARGWRIGKEKQSHKIDLVVALAQAALGAVKESGRVAQPLSSGVMVGTPRRDVIPFRPMPARF